MNCAKCGHSMEERLVSICLCDMNPPTKIKDVPARVCTRCGERLYSADVAEQLDDIRDSFGTPDHIEEMHVYDFKRVRPSDDEVPITTAN